MEEVEPVFKRNKEHKPVLKFNFDFDTIEKPKKDDKLKRKFETNQQVITINSKFSSHKTLTSLDLSEKNLHNLLGNDNIEASYFENEVVVKEQNKPKTYKHPFSWVEIIKR